MNYLRRFLSSPKKKERPVGLLLSPLNRLPLEILLCIVDYLPPESALVFSLSCMQIKRLLGTQHFKKIIFSTKRMLALQNLLALDRPNHVVCSACKCLHNMKNLRRYSRGTYIVGNVIPRYKCSRIPACVQQDENQSISSITNLFGTTAFKMAMQRYHQGAEYKQLLNAMSSKAPQTTQIGEYVRRFSEECRIIQGCLMHRLQSVYTARQCLPISRPCMTPLELICPHITLGEHHIDSGLKRCQKCRTQYRIGLRYYHYGWAFFTRWKDLGPAPEAVLWTKHLRLGGLAFFREAFRCRARSQGAVELRTELETWPQEVDLSSVFEDGDRL